MGPAAWCFILFASVGAPRHEPCSPRAIREHLREGDRCLAERRFERAEDQFRHANRKARQLEAGAERAELLLAAELGFLEATRAQLRPAGRRR